MNPKLSFAVKSFWTGIQAQEIDRLTTQEFAIPGLELMEEAGAWIAQAALARLKVFHQVIILVGNGNNGGDALVAARHLFQNGIRPHIFVMSQEPSQLSPDRKTQEERITKLGLSLNLYHNQCFRSYEGSSLFVIDGLLGLGLRGSLRAGSYEDCLKEVASLKPDFVLAIDMPSGMLSDEWYQVVPPLHANLTVSFGAPKPIHFLNPARQYLGKVQIRTLTFSPQAVTKVTLEAPSTPSLAYLARPPRSSCRDLPFSIWQNLSADAHKFDRGHVLIIGGSPGKWGAPIMAGLAAYKAGAGWVSLALAADHPNPGQIPLNLTSEALFRNGHIIPEELSQFVKNRKVRAIVIGPGCDRTPLNIDLLRTFKELIDTQDIFIVIDAGALENLGRILPNCPLNPDRVLATPHPGEWKKMGLPEEDLNSIPKLEGIRKKLFDHCGISLLYKTSTPVSPLPSGYPYLAVFSTREHKGLGRAGSGDLLCGLAAVIGMRGYRGFEVGIMAHEWLATAASLATEEKGIHSLLADDLLEQIGRICR